MGFGGFNGFGGFLPLSFGIEWLAIISLFRKNKGEMSKEELLEKTR